MPASARAEPGAFTAEEQARPYTEPMRSATAATLRRDTRERSLALQPLERVELARRLGQEDAARYASVHGVTLDEARRRLRAAGQLGRRSSCASRLG